MYIKINSESGVPLYLQIVKQVKYLVACGALKSADKLPAVRELAVQLRINPNTVAKAYRELQHEKIIDSKWGEGNFISEEIKNVSESQKGKIISEILDNAIRQATDIGLSKEELTKLFSQQLKTIKPKGAKE